MTSTKAWAASGRPRVIPRAKSARPEGSWGAAIERARASWDSLAGAPADGRYSDAAAAAILSTALGLWSDTTAAMGEA